MLPTAEALKGYGGYFWDYFCITSWKVFCCLAILFGYLVITFSPQHLQKVWAQQNTVSWFTSSLTNYCTGDYDCAVEMTELAVGLCLCCGCLIMAVILWNGYNADYMQRLWLFVLHWSYCISEHFLVCCQRICTSCSMTFRLTHKSSWRTFSSHSFTCHRRPEFQDE